jgi:hypothetical protein
LTKEQMEIRKMEAEIVKLLDSTQQITQKW